MSNQDPVEATYKQYHANRNAIDQILEFYHNTILELRAKNVVLTRKNEELERQKKEFEPPKKIEPNTTKK